MIKPPIAYCKYCCGPFNLRLFGRGRQKEYCSRKCRRLAAEEKSACDIPNCRLREVGKPHIHCPECGSVEHVAESCSMLG
jgi:hypothetical protein